ncbi:MAG: hypothetical protein ACRCW1_06280 [Anaerotignaceae bacterium]
MKSIRFFGVTALIVLGTFFVGCSSDTTGTNLGRTIDGVYTNDGYYDANGDYYDANGEMNGNWDGTYYDEYGNRYDDRTPINYDSYNSSTTGFGGWGTGYNGGVSGTMYGDDSGYSNYNPNGNY